MPNAGYAQVRRTFFDKNPALRFVNKKTRKVLAKFGAYVRRSAQTSMRPDPKKGQKSAKPGQAPRYRGRKLLRDLICFNYDASTKSVVIGPLRLGKTASEHVPKVLEFGGNITRDGKTEHYASHPFMRPAFQKNEGWVAAEYAKP